MENFITRYRNATILVAVLFAQVLGLAVQVKRTTENESTRLIRIWTVSAVTPFEKGIVWCQLSAKNVWHDYFYLRGIRQENRELKAQIERLRLQQVRLNEDAEQARRIQTLLGFKEAFISQTIAAQVIGSSGSEQSRSVYIDKGARDGIRTDMSVITADGVVGKVLRTFNSTSQVLLIDDQTSGVGAILENSRLQGVLRGTPSGEIVLEKVMSDETVPSGEKVVTSGGDQIFPKGLPVGTVTKVSPGSQLFLNIRVKPSADLGRLEEVLVITQQEEREPEVSDVGRARAADILAQRLPSVPDQVVDPARSDAGKIAGNPPEAVPSPGAPAKAVQVPTAARTGSQLSSRQSTPTPVSSRKDAPPRETRDGVPTDPDQPSPPQVNQKTPPDTPVAPVAPATEDKPQ
jgi:rod shape-determining protein MreC